MEASRPGHGMIASMADRWWSWRWLTVAFCGGLLLFVLATGIWPFGSDKGPPWLAVENLSDEAVVLFATHAPPSDSEEWRVLGPIEPGQKSSLINMMPCGPSTMIARTLDGVEIYRRDEPLCSGQTWVIGGP